jgi:arylsulfatase A-like enzyme
MTRNKTILSGLLLAASLVLPLSVQAADDARKRNMIFILVDDLRYDGMGFLQPELRTPNIDALAAEGVYFPNAVVTTSLCSPSRATILTGRTTRNHGVVDNNNSSEEGLVFFPRYLQEAGYETGFFGKWHMGEDSDAPRPGFNRWVSFRGQGSYYPTDNLPPELLARGVRHQLNVNGEHVPQAGYITDELTDYALDWLRKGRDPSKPFFLYLSHKAVHSDAVPAERHEGQYAKTRFRLPQGELSKNKPMWVHNQRNSWHGIDFFYASDRKMTDYLKDYYGALSSVDDSLGRIVAWLRESGLQDNTMVVFYSDNGFLIGEHGLVDKRNAYQASVRVPMLISAPGLLPRGVTNEVRVRNLDLAPTFLDVAGVEPPEEFEGRSFLPVATDEISADEWGVPDFVYEYYWEWTFPMTPTTFAIQRGPLKYIQYHGIWDIEELYDLENDPREMHNLIDDPDYYGKVIELRTGLYNGLANDEGGHKVPFHARTAPGMNLRDRDGPTAAPFPEAWKVEPNRPDKFLGVFPDTPLKKKRMDEGEPYFPYMESREE